MSISQKLSECYQMVNANGVTPIFLPAVKGLNQDGNLKDVIAKIDTPDEYVSFFLLIDTNTRQTLDSILLELYLDITERLLDLHDMVAKELFLSEAFTSVNFLAVDIRDKILSYAIYLDFEPDEFDNIPVEKLDQLVSRSYFFGEGKTLDLLSIKYLQVIFQCINQFVGVIYERYARYIPEETIRFITEYKSNRRIASLSNYTPSSNPSDNVTPSYSKLKWVNNSKLDLAELAAALIATESFEFTDGNKNDGDIGAYLFRLFNVEQTNTPTDYYGHLKDIKKRNDRVVFLEQLKSAFEQYLDDGRKVKKKQRSKNNPTQPKL